MSNDHDDFDEWAGPMPSPTEAAPAPTAKTPSPPTGEPVSDSVEGHEPDESSTESVPGDVVDVEDRVKDWRKRQSIATYRAQARGLLNLDGIPAALRGLSRWVLWRFTDKGPGQKPGKEPLQANGRLASTTDPATWTTFEQACQALACGVGDGVGFVFTNDDDIVGIDFDGCRDPVTGELASWAAEDLARLGSWAEVSPTGTGVHVFALGALAEDVKNKTPDGRREAYETGRYFTMTGRHVEGTPADLVTTDVTTWHAERFPSKVTAPPTNTTPMIQKLMPEWRAPPPSNRHDRVERARRYLDRADPAVSGNRGHDTTMRVVGAVVRGFDLTDAEARQVLGAWNARCVPPWLPTDLQHKIAEAQKTPDPQGRARGWRFDEELPMQSTSNHGLHSGPGGAANDDVDPEAQRWQREMDAARADLEQAMGTSAAYLATPCDFVSYRDLMAKNIPPMSWLVQGLVTDGAVAAISGEPKTAKTWLALELATAVALGDKALGEFLTGAPRGVALFLTEDHEANVRARLKGTIRGHQGEPQGDPPVYVKARGALDLSNVDCLAWLVASVRRLPKPPALIVIDPLRNVMGSLQENSNDDMAKANAALRALRDVLGAAVLYVHHAAKLSETSATRRAGQRMRGGGALHGGYDAGIHLMAPGHAVNDDITTMTASVDVEVKAGRGAGSFAFELRIHDDDKRQCVRADWVFQRETRAAQSTANTESDVDARIQAAFDLVGATNPMSKTALKTLVGGNGERVGERIDALIKAGQLGERAGPRGARLISRVDLFPPPVLIPVLLKEGERRMGEIGGGATHSEGVGTGENAERVTPSPVDSAEAAILATFDEPSELAEYTTVALARLTARKRDVVEAAVKRMAEAGTVCIRITPRGDRFVSVKASAAPATIDDTAVIASESTG